MDRLETSATADLLHHLAGTALPSGPLVGLDRAVKAARALAIRSRKGKVAGIDSMAPHPDAVEAALRGAARPAVAGGHHTPTWTMEAALRGAHGGLDTVARDALVDRMAREIHSETCTGRPCGSCPRPEDLAAAWAVLFLLEAEGLQPEAEEEPQVSGGLPGEASSAEARPAKADYERHYPTWTVDTDPLEGGPWTIRRDGRLVDTVAAHYAVDEVLAVAEQHARCALAWVLDPTLAGFRSVTSAEVEAL